MQILASALPGFRDLRPPLIAGYLWLLLLWIVAKPDLSTRPTNEIAASIYDLGKAAGAVWVGLAVSVAAYLIGSISQYASELIKAAFIRFENRSAKPYVFRYLDNDEQVRLVESTHPIDKLTRQAQIQMLRAGWNPEKEHDRAEMGQAEFTISTRAARARQGMWKELAMPSTLLLGKETELFTEADRLKSESELRLAVAVPMAAIFVFLTVSSTWMWIFALSAIVLLITQGYDRDRKFRSLMEAAVIRGTIRSESIEEYNRWVQLLPLDGEPPTAAR